MHILVDTNVFLDLILEREDYYPIAKNFFKNVYLNKSKIFISSISVRDIGYIVGHVFHNQEKGKDAQMRAYELSHKILNVEDEDVINALYSYVKDFEDALLIEGAKRELLDLIVTNNTKDFENSGFPVCSPDFFNQMVEKVLN